MLKPSRCAVFVTASLILSTIPACRSASGDVPAGYLPVPSTNVDALLPASFSELRQTPAPVPQEPRPGKTFELPPGLPGSSQPQAANQPAKFPTLPPIIESNPPGGEPLTLATLQLKAGTTNPVLRKVQADADAAYGAMMQAGLYPNPTLGYQADQMQPWATPTGNAGQQGVYLNQLVKTAGKLSLAQQVAGFDYLNALVTTRRTQIEIISQIRTSYFAVLIAQQSVEVNRSLATLADEIYQLQLKQVKAGEAAAYEPLQLYAQAVQARNNLEQARANSRAAWRQLAVALGQPNLASQALAGLADSPPPVFAFDSLARQISENHTDLLMARNKLLQAQAHLRLQEVTPLPDLQTNLMVQYDNVGRTPQLSVQLGVALPLYDRNQGNIRQAQANIASTSDAILSVENDLVAKLAEARSRYESSTVQVINYRDLILPNLTNAYRAMIRRYQVEPDKVTMNEIVLAQQNLAQSMQAYLNALDAQWKAVVDIAGIAQLDDLYATPAKPSAP